MAFWDSGEAFEGGLDGWRESVVEACRWIVDTAMIRTPEHGFGATDFAHADRYDDWRGAFRGEYRAADRAWDVFCPVWHGGQGVKALAMAYEALKDNRYLTAACQAAHFLLRNQIAEEGHDDFGLIRAYEAGAPAVNTSAVLECLDGLFELSRVGGDGQYAAAAVAALRWVARKMFIPEEGLFRDHYDPVAGKALPPKAADAPPGRPLLDDGVFLKGYDLTKDESLREVAVRTASRLLLDEDPPGNWKRYPPASARTGVIHPRHAYWWGRPMWRVYHATHRPGALQTGEVYYLDCCRRAAEWYVKAMRLDGGLFRATDGDFNTPCFGHATSGIACAAVLWLDLIREFEDIAWREPVTRALRFCRSVQFRRTDDPNLAGAVLEKLLPPGGSDRPPWYLRDVGTFFYVQAVCQALRDAPELLKP